MNIFRNRFLAPFLCFFLLAVASMGQAETTQVQPSSSARGLNPSEWQLKFLYAIGWGVGSVTKALLKDIFSEAEVSTNETAAGNYTENNYITSTFIHGAAALVSVTATGAVSRFFFFSKMDTLEQDPTLPAAKENLASYLALSPQKQKEFLSTKQSAVFDLVPALRLEGALESFVQSKGLKSLNSDELTLLLSNTGPQGITLLASLTKPALLIEQEFFQILDKGTKLNIVFLASPQSYYLKKSFFISLDVARNLLLWKYLLGKSLGALVLQEIIFQNNDQAQALLDAVEAISGSAVRAGIKDPVLYNVSPRLQDISRHELRPYGLVACTLSLLHSSSVADDTIVDTYGKGLKGLTGGSVKMIMLPAIEVYNKLCS